MLYPDKRRGAGGACLVRALKGFSTTQVVPVLFPTPKVLKTALASAWASPPGAGGGERQRGELGDVSCILPPPGHGSAPGVPRASGVGPASPTRPPSCGAAAPGCSASPLRLFS